MTSSSRVGPKWDSDGQGCRPATRPETAAEDPCWQFARVKVKEILGVELPAEYAAALLAREALADEVPAGEACRAGDIVLMRAGNGRPHCGVAVSAFRAEHVEQGQTLGFTIAWAKRAGVVTGIVRPRRAVGLGGGAGGGSPGISNSGATE